MPDRIRSPAPLCIVVRGPVVHRREIVEQIDIATDEHERVQTLRLQTDAWREEQTSRVGAQKGAESIECSEPDAMDAAATDCAARRQRGKIGRAGGTADAASPVYAVSPGSCVVHLPALPCAALSSLRCC